MSIKDNIISVKSNIPASTTLVAVSKTKPNSAIEEVYKTGQRIFGENKVQELAQKFEDLPKDIKWHMIGHLQSNKVKYIAPFVSLIHGVDSLKLLKEINKQAAKNNRIIDCLLQVHIAEEQTKFGFHFDEVAEIMKSDLQTTYSNTNIIGLMGMATNTDNSNQVKKEFKELNKLFITLKTSNFKLQILSMGMSGDYKLAIEEGSTMVRVGSAIFGSRN